MRQRLSTAFGLLVTLLFAAVSVFAQSEKDAFAGKFTGTELSVSIEATDGNYSGSIAMEGKDYPLKARKQGPNSIAGTFQVGADSFDFSARLEAGKLLLKSGDSTYTLTREREKKNPLDRSAQKSERPENPLAKKTESASNDWKLFKHPFGLSIRYPADWKVQEAPDGSGYLLIPPGIVPGAEEIYVLAGQPAGDIANADDPRLAVAAEQVMAQIGPLLQRTGPVEKVRAATTSGISLLWETATGARARMFVTILKGQAIGITGIGLKDKIAAREPMLKRIFETLAAGEFSQDPRVTGVWNRLGTTSLDARDNNGRLQASSVGDHQHTLTLRADGTCASREVSRTIALGQGVGIDTGDQVTAKNGRWYAGDGKLGLVWENAEPQEYNYEVRGETGNRQMVFKLDAGRGQLWGEGR